MEGLVSHVLQPEESGRFHRIWEFVYNKGNALPEGRSWTYDGDIVLGVEVHGQPAGAAILGRHQVNRSGATLSMGAVAEVGVLPEYRLAGVGREIMRLALETMVEEGMQLSCLYAFREPYYRNMGYEVSGIRTEIKCPGHRLPNPPVTLPLRQISAQDFHELKPCYEAFARAHNGATLRTDAQWRRRFGIRTPLIYAVGDPVEAYFWTQMEGWFWEDLSLGEVVWSTARGYESLMGALNGLCINRTALTWFEPEQGPFAAQYLDQGMSVSASRWTMWRVLDMVSSMEALRPHSTGSFVVQIEDENLAANTGSWLVEFSPEGVSCSRTQQSPDIVAGIAPWSQAFLGSPSLTRLVELGKIECKDPEKLRVASNLLSPNSVVCTEFF